MVKIDIKVCEGKAFITIEDYMFLCNENNIDIAIVNGRLELIKVEKPLKIETVWHDYYEVTFFKELF